MGSRDNLGGEVRHTLRHGPGPKWDKRGGGYARMPRGRVNHLEPNREPELLPIEEDHDVEARDGLPIEADHEVEQSDAEAGYAEDGGDGEGGSYG